jgi:hypothetical protein
MQDLNILREKSDARYASSLNQLLPDTTVASDSSVPVASLKCLSRR